MLDERCYLADALGLVLKQCPERDEGPRTMLVAVFLFIPVFAKIVLNTFL